MTTIKPMALAAAAALSFAGAAQAQSFEPKAAGRVMLNVRASVVAPTGDDAITTLGGAATGLSAKVSDDVMPTIGVSWFFTDHLALEVIAGTTKHTVKAVGGGTNVKVKETWVLPPVVSLQYHFAPQSRFSPYVGAGVNYMVFWGGKDRNGFQLDVKDGWGASLQAGADYALTGPWSANLDVKKVFFDTPATDAANGLKTKVKLDPWVVSAGLGYRF